MQIRFNFRVQVVRQATPRRRGGRGRLLVLAGLAGLAAIVVPLAFASGLITGFADVPPGSANHDAIDRVTNAGIMTPCQTSPQLLFCPTTALGRQWAAVNYDRMLGLTGTPGNFTPTFRGVNVVTGGSTAPFTVNSSTKVANLNADQLDGIDSTGFYAAGSTVADSAKLGGLAPSAYLPKISRFDGYAGVIPGASSAWVFAGPTVTITTAAGDLLTGSAQAPLGTTSSSGDSFRYDLCYQVSDASQGIINFTVGAYSIGQTTAVGSRNSWTAAASTPMPAGTWKVGYCVWNLGSATLDNNDFVNGWVMKTSSATQGASAVSADAPGR